MWMIVFISYLWTVTYYHTIELISVSDYTLVLILMLLFLFTWNLLSKNIVTCSYCRYIIYFIGIAKEHAQYFGRDAILTCSFGSVMQADTMLVIQYCDILLGHLCLEVCNSLLLWKDSINSFLRAAEVGKLNIMLCSHRHVHTWIVDIKMRK